MARMKQTQRRLDSKGKLPPLGPPRQPDTRWGTAAQTFYQRVVLPDNPANQRAADYRGKDFDVFDIFHIYVYCTVHCVMFNIIDLNIYIHVDC